MLIFYSIKQNAKEHLTGTERSEVDGEVVMGHLLAVEKEATDGDSLFLAKLRGDMLKNTYNWHDQPRRSDMLLSSSRGIPSLCIAFDQISYFFKLRCKSIL